MSSVCQVCLAENVELNSLKTNQLIQLYEKVFDTKFDSEDAGPKALCCSCYQKLLRCHTISEMANRSEKIFSLLSDRGLEATHENITELNHGAEQEVSVATMQLFMNNVVLQDEPISVKEEVIVKVESLSYEDCTEISLASEDSDREIDTEEVPPNIYDKPAKPDDSKMTFTCDHCNEVFLIKRKLISHIKLHSELKGNQKNFCYVCNKYFIERRNLVRHLRNHSGEKPFACNVCNKQFTDKRNLIGHLRIHTSEKPFTCYVCDKKIIDKRTLVRHLRIHTGERPFGCKLCNKKFGDERNLHRHKRTHTGEKSFACSVCYKRFSANSHVIRHMRIHTGERPFACTVCNKHFTDKCYLKSHMRIHTKKL